MKYNGVSQQGRNSVLNIGGTNFIYVCFKQFNYHYIYQNAAFIETEIRDRIQKLAVNTDLY